AQVVEAVKRGTPIPSGLFAADGPEKRLKLGCVRQVVQRPPRGHVRLDQQLVLLVQGLRGRVCTEEAAHQLGPLAAGLAGAPAEGSPFRCAAHSWLLGFSSLSVFGPRWLVHIIALPSALKTGRMSAPAACVMRRCGISVGLAPPRSAPMSALIAKTS